MDIENVRKYFENPRGRITDELPRLAFDAIQVMEEIYATGGRLDFMSPTTQKWLRESVNLDQNPDLRSALGHILGREVSTRRFDHIFMGQIHPQGNKIAILSNLIAAYMNTNTIVREVSMTEHEMELEATEWLAEIFGYDTSKSSGNIVTGGTSANLAALWVAREKVIQRLHKERKSPKGKYMYILGTRMAHYSVDKAANLLGTHVWLGRVKDTGYKTDLNDLEATIRRIRQHGDEIIAIVGLAGETETGMVDDFQGLSEIAKKYNIHLHADAAYAGPFILSKVGYRFQGISDADSIAVDPHKMLYTSYAAGAVLFKDRREHALIQRSARYLQPKGNEGVLGDPANRNFGFAARVEGSMGSEGVISTWATIKLLGEEGIAALLNHTIDLTQYAFCKIQKSTVLKPLHQPETNTLMIGVRDMSTDPSKHNSIVEAVKDGVFESIGAYISTIEGIDHGRSVFRLVPMHPYTTTADIDLLIQAMEDELEPFF